MSHRCIGKCFYETKVGLLHTNCTKNGGNFSNGGYRCYLHLKQVENLNSILATTETQKQAIVEVQNARDFRRRRRLTPEQHRIEEIIEKKKNLIETLEAARLEKILK